MKGEPIEFFTATEIGTALRKTRQAVHRALEPHPPSGKKVVANNIADAWAITDLPPEFITTLYEMTARFLYPSPRALLADPPKVWTSPLPLSRVCDADLRKAQQLKTALRRALAEPDHVSCAELARMAAEDYRRAFGESVSEGHLRTIIARTLSRDAGARDFQPRSKSGCRPRRDHGADPA